MESTTITIQMPKHEIISDKDFGYFLTSNPLYSKTALVKEFNESIGWDYLSPKTLTDKAFNYYCELEQEVKTFKTKFGDHTRSLIFGSIMDNINRPPEGLDENTQIIDYKTHLKGCCQSCNYEIDFLLQVYSDKTWSENYNMNVFIKKIGQNPPIEISLSKGLNKYLTEEDKQYYKKALISLSNSYGIGAYAYLRRVVENEIKRIIKDISELEIEGADEIKVAYSQFEKDNQMSKLIDNVNKLLPTSLKEIGDNPIRLLYEELSGGIHDYSDEICLDKAKNIDIIFNYVIKKINEEKFQLKDVKIAMKNLRNKNNS